MKRYIALMACLLAGCARSGQITTLDGNTWGTTYHITYVSAGGAERDVERAVEEVLTGINQSLSIYIDTSVISRLNASVISRLNASEDPSAWQPIDSHFETVFRRARTVYEDTGGAFNPAVGPLVNVWGFGPDGPQTPPDDNTIRRLLKLVSMDVFEVRSSPPGVRKQLTDARLDLNAIAEGYAADAVGVVLEQRGVTNYLVELGGEVRARGKRPDRSGWRVGIEKPIASDPSRRELQAVVELHDSGLSTSGNYRKRRIQNGKTAAHILNPKTGYPELSSLLSVTVLADDAMTADAYATAFVVMGMDQSLRFLESHDRLHAYFIVKDEAGNLIEKRSPGFPSGAD
jgi:thiamine biosynthesis lipoprotein